MISKLQGIKWIDDYKNIWKRKVIYKSGQAYQYNFNNVLWLTNPTELGSKSNIVFYRGESRNGVEKILQFDDYIKLFFKNGFY